MVVVAVAVAVAVAVTVAVVLMCFDSLFLLWSCADSGLFRHGQARRGPVSPALCVLRYLYL